MSCACLATTFHKRTWKNAIWSHNLIKLKRKYALFCMRGNTPVAFEARRLTNAWWNCELHSGLYYISEKCYRKIKHNKQLFLLCKLCAYTRNAHFENRDAKTVMQNLVITCHSILMVHRYNHGWSRAQAIEVRPAPFNPPIPSCHVQLHTRKIWLQRQSNVSQSRYWTMNILI